MFCLNNKHKCFQEHGSRRNDIIYLILMSTSMLPGTFKDIHKMKWEERTKQ